MIIRPRLPWLRMLFVWRGSILKQVLPQLGVILGYSVALTVAFRHYEWHSGLNPLPFSLLGLAVAIFLGFRNNASYERFWEARKLWGALVIESRTAARLLLTIPEATAVERQPWIGLLIAFAHLLREQLRGLDSTGTLTRWVPNAEQQVRLARAQFKPAVALLLLSEEMQALRQQGRLDSMQVATLEPTLSAHSHILGACERIANTPIPFTYSVIIHRVIYLFVFLLPFGLIDAVGWWTPLLVVFNAYMFFTLEALSHEIEEPFGTMPNDLALDALSSTIETSLRELAGEAVCRPEARAVDYVVT